MIVRFLTKRFIGDYEPNTGKLYSRMVSVEGDQLSLQIQDTPGGVQIQDSLPQVIDSLSKCVQWAEGFLLVYSITDYDSYLSIRPLYQYIRKVHPDSKAPVIIVGNKGDLLHARQVQTQDGIQLANELGSLFLEISTSENYEDVCDVFQHLCKEVSKLHSLSGERRRASIIPRPRSPNMQDLKRRFKQALSPKVKAPSALGTGPAQEPACWSWGSFIACGRYFPGLLLISSGVSWESWCLGSIWKAPGMVALEMEEKPLTLQQADTHVAGHREERLSGGTPRCLDVERNTPTGTSTPASHRPTEQHRVWLGQLEESPGPTPGESHLLSGSPIC
ncbi:Ras-like protein family member 11A [Plecturocebus cupreus]